MTPVAANACVDSADLGQQRAAIEAKLTEPQKLRTQAYGSSGGWRPRVLLQRPAHVAIHVGGGKVMSAPTFGDHVRMVSMDSSPINSIGRPG